MLSRAENVTVQGDAHSEATATLLPFGSIAMHRTATPAAEVNGASNETESLEYRRTSVSSLLESQQSSYGNETQG